MNQVKKLLKVIPEFLLPNINKKSLSITNQQLFDGIIQEFENIIETKSYANRVVFYHDFTICLNEENYQEYKKREEGIFLYVVSDILEEFYKILKKKKDKGKKVVPFSTNWAFRIAVDPSLRKGDLRFFCKLSTNKSVYEETDIRETYKPRHSKPEEKMNINPEIIQNFINHGKDWCEAPFREDLIFDRKGVVDLTSNSFAKIEVLLPDINERKVYYMKTSEVVISGSEGYKGKENIIEIPSKYVSTPHLKIRFNKDEEKLYLAAFGEKTILNEFQVERSDVSKPKWVELPFNSRILLNGIVGINIFKP